MTEQEWEDIDKSFEKLTDALYNLRCDPVYGQKARKAYRDLHCIWRWVKDSRQEWDRDNVSPYGVAIRSVVGATRRKYAKLNEQVKEVKALLAAK